MKEINKIVCCIFESILSLLFSEQRLLFFLFSSKIFNIENYSENY